MADHVADAAGSALLAGVSPSDGASARVVMLANARERLAVAVKTSSTPAQTIRKLGGCERASTLLVLASLDVDGDGSLTPSELDRYQSAGAQLIEATKNYHLNNGVVAALVLSVVFGLAYEEKATLEGLAQLDSWTQSAVADVTSFVAMQLSVSTSSVLISSRLYTQITFWMPDLDAQLWFINESATVTSYLESCKNFTLFATLLTLGLEGAVTTTWLNVLAFIPVITLVAAYVFVEQSLSRRSEARLGTDLRRVIEAMDRTNKGSSASSLMAA